MSNELKQQNLTKHTIKMKQTNPKEQYEEPLLLDIAPVTFIICKGDSGDEPTDPDEHVDP